MPEDDATRRERGDETTVRDLPNLSFRLYAGRAIDGGEMLLFCCPPDQLPALVGIVADPALVGVPARSVPPGVVGTIVLTPMAALNILPRPVPED